MNLTGELALLAAGLLCTAVANGSRTAVPELVNDKGRDRSGTAQHLYCVHEKFPAGKQLGPG